MNLNKNPHFVLSIAEELKRVSFPNRRQTVKLTATVLGISLIVAIYLGIIDVLLTKVLEIISKSK